MIYIHTLEWKDRDLFASTEGTYIKTTNKAPTEQQSNSFHSSVHRPID